MSSRTLTTLDFRRALGQFVTGITVVTVERAPHAVHGMTANSFTSVSLVPPLVSVCVEQRAHLLPLLVQRQRFGINVLKANQQPVSEFFARLAPGAQDGETPPHLLFRWTEQGIPVLGDALCQIGCHLHATHVAGDHTIVVGEVLSAVLSHGEPLVYFQGGYTRLSR